MARRPRVVVGPSTGRVGVVRPADVTRPGATRPGSARPAPARSGGARPVVVAPVRPARPVPVVEPAPRSSAVRERARVGRVIERIHARAAKVDAEFFAMGEALLSLDRPAVLSAFGSATFHAFLDEHVMPVSTATRLMTIAREYSAPVATSLGVEKAFHLVQYAEVAQTRWAAEGLATRDVRIGGQRVSLLSAEEVANAVRALKLGAARAAIPKVTRREQKLGQRLVREFEERYGVDASVRVDKKRGVVRIEAKLSELLED